ncbi:MAG: hypothetical protein JWM68_1096 [Verrucomicrobiales bacterium]|nr:hypothetical protein [Verrucomicrobiales bacterium]
MKRILIVAGLIAVAVNALHAAYTPGLSAMEKAKKWSVSASVRGFYDDNYTTSPKGFAQSSFGFEVSPSASLNIPLEQTFFGASYIYSLKYYQDRADKHQASADHSHQFGAKLDHAFSERYKMTLSETFVVAQEPEILNALGTVTVPLRLNGNNIRNTAAADFTAQMTELMGLQFAYQNNYYDYDQSGPGSYSAALDRMEHLASANLRYQWQRPTVLIAGYQFGLVNYLSNDSLVTAGPFVSPEIRDNRSHYLFIGADHSFNQQLNAAVRVGARYTDYYEAGGNSITPYADGNLTYTYAPGSYLQAGVRHDRSQTDVLTTLDQEATTVYVAITHRITSLLTGNVLGQYQHSSFNEKTVTTLPGSKGSDNYFVASVNLAYRIDRAGHWLAETGYNYDKLNSDLPFRAYTRNRVYIGIRATY